MCMDRVIIVCGTFWLYALVSLYYKFRTKSTLLNASIYSILLALYIMEMNVA